MGVDCAAVLFYGIVLDDIPEVWNADFTLPNGDKADYHDVNDDWNRCHRPPELKEDGVEPKYHGPAWDAWRVALNAYEASEQYVELGYHCSSDSPKWHIKGKFYKAWLGEGVPVPPSLTVDPQQDAIIQEFCERYGLPYSQPAWHLVSYYSY